MYMLNTAVHYNVYMGVWYSDIKYEYIWHINRVEKFFQMSIRILNKCINRFLFLHMNGMIDILKIHSDILTPRSYYLCMQQHVD